MNQEKRERNELDPCSEEKKKDGDIGRSLEHLRYLEEKLSGIVSNLEKRISPILEDVSPEPCEDETSDKSSPLSEIAREISYVSDRIDNSIVRIAEMIDRVDL